VAVVPTGVGAVVFDDAVPATDLGTVTALVQNGPGAFTATVDPRWTNAGTPNGGYLLAMMGRAASGLGPHRHVIAASAHYLHSPDPGPVRITAEVLRAGRSASQVHTRMLQDGRPCVDALLTVANLDPEAKPYWDAGLPAAAAPPPQRCIRLSAPPGPSATSAPSAPAGRPPGLAVPPIMQEVQVLLDPACLGFATGQPGGQGELRGWLALAGETAFDPVSLLFAVDAFPPATFDIEFAGWVPTLELSVYVRALPAPGPVQVLQRAQLIDGQRVDEACFVWDAAGRLVAQATQLAGIRLG
jgi:acyl-coenzyme A thioesterase PaaI-like protein